MFKYFAIAILLAVVPNMVSAQQPLSMAAAVQSALQNYPAIQVSQEQLNAASAAIRLARTAYLPHVDALAQANRATRNNVFGLMLPQSVIPSISGPVLGSNNTGTAFGSALGVLVSWEPFDFGLRRATVAAADATRAQSEAALKTAQFQVAVSTADAYLTLVASQEMVRESQAAVERSETILRTIKALTDAELRPGADASRAEAEVAAARTQLVQAGQAVDMARIALSRLTGTAAEQIAVSSAHLLQLPPEEKPAALNAAANPVAREQQNAIEKAEAELKVLERSWFPHFYLQGSAYARGTGAETDGKNPGYLNGLAPTTQNFAIGLTATFPVMDRPALQAREAAQQATLRAQQARARQIANDLKAQWDSAVAAVRGARRVAASTPVQVSSARTTLQQATARYEAGLGNLLDVADAQRLLTQAEIDDSLARLGVWRGMLSLATAAGDLQPYLAEASSGAGQ